MCLGIPGKIVEFVESPGLKMCKVDFGGVIRQVCIETIPDAKIGDFTIVHAGFALSILSEEEARETMEALQELALAEQQVDQERLAGKEA